MTVAPTETEPPKKFEFGKNWLSYAQTALTKEKVESGRSHFRKLCQDVFFNNKTFLDIGFGQGLALYYAAELGAKVYGLDPDPGNVIAAKETGKFFDQSYDISLIEGSILNRELLMRFSDGIDIVYSWGVLHHTGNLDIAFKNSYNLVKPGGYFIVAIYNRHLSSPFWKGIKWLYNYSPPMLQKLFLGIFFFPLLIASWILTKKNPFASTRGMDFYHDLRDWVGGYPYEYLSKKEILEKMPRNFQLLRYLPPLVPTGNHQLVFQRIN